MIFVFYDSPNIVCCSFTF